jgi:acetoin utilization deacetylase AcuC-like enzyme
MPKAGYLIDERFRRHETGSRHPESPDRLTPLQKALDSCGASGRWRRIEPRPASPAEVERIHSRAHIERVRQASEEAPSLLDMDTPASSASFETALLAAGGVLACADAVCSGTVTRAFAFVRPPGHHAEPERAMGFCLFNNIALAAAHLRAQHGLERIAIVDFDLHHGNGTQACFYRDPGVVYISTHQFPYYPGTGAFREVGAGEGRGATLNFPLPAGSGDGIVVPIYARIVSALLDQYQPQFVLVSAGFDAYFGDPLGGLKVTPAGFGSIAASLLKAADRCCAGKICFVLEGGYSPIGLEECTRAVLAEMESDAPDEHDFPEDPLFRVIARHAEGEFGERWSW